MAVQQQVCAFRIGSLMFGIEVNRVQEVVKYLTPTRVPLAPPELRGLINLRGQIVPAIDLRVLLGLPELRDANDPINVIINADDGSVSLLVDCVEDVLTIDVDDMVPPPRTLQGSSRSFILGAYKLSDRLLVVLDPDEIVGARERR